ncbi:MAG: hypothetical protein GX621_07555 [Pirellulaceae bacterium]|nr:hypothetical protein [Pirellulaceae bacterium]
MSIIEERKGEEVQPTSVEWTALSDLSNPPKFTYECRIYLLREDDGRYSAWLADLPGIASHGSTLNRAVENIKEAFIGALSVYQTRGSEVPWLARPEEKPTDALERWILVDA